VKLKLATIIVVFAQAIIAPITSLGQPSIVAPEKLPAFFPGANSLTLIWTNRGPEQIEMEIKGAFFQTSSKLALRLPVEIVEKLRLLLNQAALMPIRIDVPEVRAKTLFVIRWQDVSAKALGKTELNVYPREMLRELETMAGDTALGIFNLDAKFETGFRKSKVKIERLEQDGIGGYAGKLLIAGGEQAQDSSRETLIALARRGVVIVCIVAHNDDETLRPNFFARAYGTGVVVFVQEMFLDHFDTNPESQLRLVEICRMATKPGVPELPMIFQKTHNEN
jgi:hypothetical protein